MKNGEEPSKLKFKIPFKTAAAGIREGLPLAFGYLPVSVTFGILAKAYGFPVAVPILMSLLVYAGSSQFVGIQMMAMGTSPVQIVLTIFIVNIRHFLMGTTMTQRLSPDYKSRHRALLGYFLTDEAFVYLSSRETMPDFWHMVGFEFSLYMAWISGTVIGTFAPSQLSPILSASLGITIYALFISLLIPTVKREKKMALLCIGAGVFSYALASYHVPTGWRIIIATVGSALLGTLLIKETHLDGEFEREGDASCDK
ncbi:MAG: hypothetical protein PWP51_886 [Clostridiales bacterium]|nr:hypothetical protein [Clostridiales bacterium]MDN5298333.1 hypothetical protein [Clostridiales bacterium]